MNTTKICSANWLPFACRTAFWHSKFGCRRTGQDRAKHLIYISFLVSGCAFRELKKSFPLSAAERTKYLQSGKSKNLHQPFGLMSPATTWQDRGGRNRVQAAQVRPPFGRS